jgi:iron only hydrogenase large subunit-like protein
MLAPAFAIDFKYPNIIGMLRHLGFDKVTELTYGARMVNWSYADYIKDHPGQKFFISSPCPAVVSLIQAKYPELVEYLMPIVSPMAAMAMIYKKHHPDYKVVFISPCYAKEKIEAPKFPEFIDAVITLQELKQIFKDENIKEGDFSKDYYFDSFIREYTKIYPISGGLASTSHLSKLFKKGEILVTDGASNLEKILDEVKTGQSKYRFLDLLYCDGGCIGGPGISNKDLSVEQKKKIILEYTGRSSEHTMGKHEGKVDYAKNIDFGTAFKK